MATQPAGRDLLTIAPGMTTVSSPMRTPLVTILLAPMETRSSMKTAHLSALSAKGAPRSLEIEW